MKTRYIFLLFAISSLYLIGCQPKNSAQELLENIENLATDETYADSVIVLKTAFIDQFPSHPKSAQFTYQIAEYFKSKDAEKAADYYLLYFKQFKDSLQAANSLINAAFLKETTQPLIATDLYKKFLQTFPEDERCEIVRENLRFVGRDAEFIYNQLKAEGKLKEEETE